MNTSYSEFLATHPPLFSGGRDPLEADDWLYTIESKFSLLNCTEYQKTLYAAQQLRGPAGAWWASYTAALPADHYVPWGEFRTAFRGHHLSAGTMRRKLAEFLDLRQGSRSVYEYIQEFNNLAQYGSHHVDTDVKKAELFRKGLTIQLQDRLILSQNLSYNELASAAIDQEGTMKACEVVEEKGRKRAVSGPSRGGSSSAPPKYRMTYTPPAGQRATLRRSSGAIAHNSSNSNSNSTTALRQHNSSRSRWQSGHPSSLRLPVTRATIAEKSATSPRTVVSPGWAMHLVFRLLG
jgi:hypothetical protein